VKWGITLYDKEMPPLLRRAMTIRAVWPKELKNYFLSLLEREIREKGEEEVIREIYRLNYPEGEESKEEVLNLLLSMERAPVSEPLKEEVEKEPKKEKEPVREEKREVSKGSVKNLAQKLRSLGE